MKPVTSKYIKRSKKSSIAFLKSELKDKLDCQLHLFIRAVRHHCVGLLALALLAYANVGMAFLTAKVFTDTFQVYTIAGILIACIGGYYLMLNSIPSRLPLLNIALIVAMCSLLSTQLIWLIEFGGYLLMASIFIEFVKYIVIIYSTRSYYKEQYGI